MRIPPRKPASAARVISATAASTSCRIGTIATPARRNGLSEQSSASQRLWACAPARRSSGSRSPPCPSPAPKGADAPEVTASASGKMTSPATPSASSSLSRRAASQPPRKPSSLSRSHASANSSLRMPRARELVLERGPRALLFVEGVVVLRVEPVPVLQVREPGVAVGRNDHVPLHEPASPRYSAAITLRRRGRGRRSAGARRGAASRRGHAS